MTRSKTKTQDHEAGTDITNAVSTQRPSQTPGSVLKTPQSLIHIKHRISLRQYKMWVLMLRRYRECLNTQSVEGGMLILPKSALDDFFGYEVSKREVEADLEALRKEPIIFNVLNKDGESEKQGQGFISEWSLTTRRIGFKLPTHIAEAVEHLEDKIFSLINLSIFNHFSGKYEAILYKLCNDYIGVGNTPYMDLERFRQYMGLKPGEYDNGRDFNRHIIVGPVERINNSELCDIYIEPQYRRLGRKMVGVYFSVRLKKQATFDFAPHPAFLQAVIPILPAVQKRYLEKRTADEIVLCIERANVYMDQLKAKGKDADPGAIYNKAVEENWGAELAVKKEVEQKERAAKEKKAAEAKAKKAAAERENLKKEFIQLKTKELIAALTKPDLLELVRVYLESAPEKARFFREDSCTFSTPVERISFTGWLNTTLKYAFREAEFDAWLANMKPAKKGAVA
jgi:hypothetical protein